MIAERTDKGDVMAWAWLVAAGVCEVVWAVGLKRYGFTVTWGGLFTIIMMLLSFILLQQAMKSLPLGTSYAVWTGIGAVGSVVWGMLVLHEPRDLPRLVCLMLIIAGIVGLKLWSPNAN
jgi:quaternary ammonium compound-resistance protein SugE